MKRAALFITLLVACDTLPAVVIPVDTSGATTDASTIDASVPPFEAGPPCGLDVPFGTPKPLAALNVFTSEESARLTPDELTIYFSATASTAAQIYTATRSDRTKDFGAPTLVPAPPNGAATQPNDNAFDPAISAEQTDLFFASSRAASPQVFVAHRASPALPFGEPVALTPADGASRLWPNLGPADVLWFAREDFDAGAIAGLAFWNAALDGGAAHPVTIAGIDTILLSPAPSADGSVLYFATYRPSFATPQIHRASKSGANYAAVTPVAELAFAGAGDNGVRPSFVSPDGCRLYFSMDGYSRQGHDDLFVAEKAR